MNFGEGQVIEKPKKAAKAEKPAKKVEAPRKPKAKKSAKSSRGHAKFPVGTKLAANYKGARLELTVLAEGFDLAGQNYPSLTKLVDAVAGENQAQHLRAISYWKAITE